MALQKRFSELVDQMEANFRNDMALKVTRYIFSLSLQKLDVPSNDCNKRYHTLCSILYGRPMRRTSRIT